METAPDRRLTLYCSHPGHRVLLAANSGSTHSTCSKAKARPKGPKEEGTAQSTGCGVQSVWQLCLELERVTGLRITLRPVPAPPLPVGIPLVLNAYIFFTFPHSQSLTASCSAWAEHLGLPRGASPSGPPSAGGPGPADSCAPGQPYGDVCGPGHRARRGRFSACSVAAGGGAAPASAADPDLCPQV